MKLLNKIALTVLSGILLVSCSAEMKKTGEETADSTATEKVYPVKTEIIAYQHVSRTLDYSANLSAFQEINYAPASPGRIDNILVEVGSRVSKGQKLVEMDKTQLIQAQKQYENAKFNYLRIDTLHQLGSISEQQYEATKTQYEVAKTSYEYLKENTSLISPINGVVTGKYFENGELYSGAPSAATGGKAAIVSLMQINPLKAIVSITQSYYPDIKEGMQVEITNDIFPDKKFSGKIFRVYPTIDASTRTFKSEIIIDNPNEILRPGMYGNLSIKLKDDKAMVVSSIAILKQEGTNNRYVFINKNGIAKKVEVKLGVRYDDKIEIISSEISAGDELIIEGQANLMQDSKVKVVKR
ncbi:MAG: efflux RND transporter periplasmic adaptor subunit [Bacteroidales bacterium]|nr:efflux RND transporter periplasmic adaptor subunit [Bacteroidales bacterium]MBN2818948.1 efflux RND transporter periplasmic adaptor subunit [Bacteroidales bacterium]